MKRVILTFFALAGVALFLPLLASSQDNNTVVTAITVNCAADSLDIPVFLVDGVEVSVFQLDSIPPEDIETMTVIKNPEITKLFAPRRGGVVVMTTKSKKFLKPILENWESAKGDPVGIVAIFKNTPEIREGLTAEINRVSDETMEDGPMDDVE